MSKENDWTNSVSRRSFLSGLAASAIPAVPITSNALVPPTSEQALSAPVKSVENTLLDLALLRFGSYLQSDEVAQVKKGLMRIGRMRAELQKFPIHNGDAPDCLFHADGL